MNIKVKIGRLSGPSTDKTVETMMDPRELDAVKDTIAMVNEATNRKEQWFVEAIGQLIVPMCANWATKPKTRS